MNNKTGIDLTFFRTVLVGSLLNDLQDKLMEACANRDEAMFQVLADELHDLAFIMHGSTFEEMGEYLLTAVSYKGDKLCYKEQIKDGIKKNLGEDKKEEFQNEFDEAEKNYIKNC